MSIQRWDPWRDVMSLREAMNSLLEESFVPPRAGMAGAAAGMAMDLRETDDAYTVETVLPGVKPEDVQITILNDTLRISGEVADEGQREGEKWLVRERRFGRFDRSITLPNPVRSEEANAEFENGILKITLPKSEEQRPRQIQVKQAQEITSGQRQEDIAVQSGEGQQQEASEVHT